MADEPIKLVLKEQGIDLPSDSLYTPEEQAAQVLLERRGISLSHWPTAPVAGNPKNSYDLVHLLFLRQYLGQNYGVPQHRITIDFQTAARFISSISGAGAATSFGSNPPLELATGTGAPGSHAGLSYGASVGATIPVHDLNPFMSGFINANPTSVGHEADSYITFGYTDEDQSNLTNKHFGILIKHLTGGTIQCYASWSDGSTHTVQLISGNPGAGIRFYIKQYSGDRIDFWMAFGDSNQLELVYSAEANLPTGDAADDDNLFTVSTRKTSGTGASLGVDVGPVEIAWDSFAI